MMELGFPVSLLGNFKSVRTIAEEIKNRSVCPLARSINNNIDVTAAALGVAKAFRIHVLLGTSTLHIKSKLQKTFTDLMAVAFASIKHARHYTDDLEFSCEDARCTPINNLCRIVEAAINASATIINIAGAI